MKFSFPACPLPPGSSVWAYLRDSGGDGQDLASQRAYLLAYCEHYRLHLARLFEDTAISGGSLVGRDEFELMIELARRDSEPAVNAIIYWDLKRFARNQLDSQFFKADLRRRGYKLISLSDDIPDSEFAIVFEAFLEWKAQKDRQDISKDVKRGLAFIVGLKDEHGNYLGIAPGRPPTFFMGEKYDTGLKRNDGRPRIVQRWVPDPETWEKGRIAWQMRSERASYKEIEREIQIFRHLADPRGVYSTIFQNEIYIGRFKYSGQVYDDFVPALATPEQWDKVQQLRFKRPGKGQKHPRGKPHPKTGRGKYLLSGLCRCLYCGSAMHGNQNTRRDRSRYWQFYACAQKKARPEMCESKQVSVQRLDEAVIQVVCSRVLTVDYVSQLVDEVNEILSDTSSIEAQIKREKKHLGELEQAVVNLLDMAEVHPSPDVIERLQQRERERDHTRHIVNQLQLQLQYSEITVDEGLIVAVLADTKMSLKAGEVKTRQMILRQTVVKIEVGRDIARLHYRFPLDTLVGDYSMPPTGFEPVSPP